jgi:diacylglycerol kinase (ATP)
MATVQIGKNQSFHRRMRFALDGIAHSLSSEHSLRIQVGALLAILVVLVLLRPAPLWWALVAVASSAVLSSELLNTAIEQLADHLHPQFHPQIRTVKDCAAAAVLISSAGALAVAAALAVELTRRWW